jgi:hypothetical protein
VSTLTLDDIDSVLMKNLSKYIGIIKRFGVSISNLRALHDEKEIDQFLVQYMEQHVQKEMDKIKNSTL